MNSLFKNINVSLNTLNGPVYKLKDLQDYFHKIQENNNFNVNLVGISSIKNWSYDEKLNFSHDSKKFFSIKSVNYGDVESGILHQSDIGILGVLTTEIKGVTHFLIQFKEEPGNINKAQLSPTIQATKSNYSRAHGGNFPPYWEKFIDIPKEKYIVDSLQPEQGLRYWKKFNQNVIAEIEYIEEQQGFKWMTLGQILSFTNLDNSINSCLRSVLSLLPFISGDESKEKNNDLEDKIANLKKEYNNYGKIKNNIEKFYSAENDSFKFFSENDKFSIKGVEVNIENREVGSWFQPIIIESNNIYYVLLRFFNKNSISYCWSIFPEPGYVNGFTVGPSEIIKTNNSNVDEIKSKLIKKYGVYGNIKKVNHINMSEEGGRFWRVSIPHFVIDIDIKNNNSFPENCLVLDESESRKLLLSKLISMEGRSIFLLSKGLKAE